MPSTVVEIRPDRRLLDHEFEGYKLNLQALPHYSHELAEPVDRLFPDDVQYSFVHAKLFALHNHLVSDFWDYRYSFYYIDNKQQVRLVSFDSTAHTFQNTVVYDVPAHVERKPGHFNLCLAFPSSNLAVVSDGTGYLHIIETGQRSKASQDCPNQAWQTVHSCLVLGEGKYFIIVDTRVQEKEVDILHCLLQSVEQSDSHFISVLTWVKFEKVENNWKQISMRQLQGKGIVHYAAIETNFTAVYVASDNPFKFTLDTEKEITVKSNDNKPRNIIYTWLQTTEDISITLKLQENFDKKLLHVNVTPLAIKISYAGNNFIDGKLKHKVDSELTTWNVQENGQVDILLTKSDSMLWEELIEGGDPNGEQIMDASLVEEAHRRLAHLCSETEVIDKSVPNLSMQELEECDAASEEDTVLVRMDTETHETTHRISLSVHQYLFSIKLETNEVPALALRHDVDACVWQPYAELINTQTWPVKHQGTLLAFGYVQSSKQNRKFITCPPNFAYSVVSEASRHIFIYQSSSNQESQLRKRTGGVMKTVKVGQQHVFNIDKYGEVLGINATNDFLFVLTKDALVAIGIE
ncbi:hypothetical protein O0L34_g12827 [Tuta absoluta]|nr:hypothetical protein O0L34_g12827 [Tuta absoluta]